MVGGGLITGCIALFTGKSSLFKTNGPVTQCSGPAGNGPVTQWGRFSVGGWRVIRGNLLYLQPEILTIPLTDSVNCESLSGPNIHHASGFPGLYRKH